MKEIILILDNIRSLHNVGSIYRSADAFSVSGVWSCGVTSYPKIENDSRLPHVIERSSKVIAKTSLGAELRIPTAYFESTEEAIEQAIDHGFSIVALEQSTNSIDLSEFSWKGLDKIVIVLGEETEGIKENIINKCHEVIEIPMLGQKESLNVSVATGVALYALRHSS